MLTADFFMCETLRGDEDCSFSSHCHSPMPSKRYVELRRALTDAQLRAQSELNSVPALRTLNFGERKKSARPFRARPSSTAALGCPEVTLVKHIFLRYVVLQANVTNSASALEGRTLADVAFVVAETSDDAVLPNFQVPIKTLPSKRTGCSWFVLSVSPGRVDETVFLTCELRYTVLAADASLGETLSFNSASIEGGRTYVEELQEIQLSASDLAF